MKKLLALILVCVTFSTGCSTAWLSTFNRYAAQVAPSANAVIAILTLFGVVPPNGLGAKISADVSAATTLVSDFANASQAAQPGVRSQITAAETTLTTDLNTLFSISQVSDKNTQAKITALNTLIDSLCQSAFAALPQASGPKAMMRRSVVHASTVATSFAPSFNKILTAKTGNAGVDDLTPSLKLPEHGKVVRIASLGMLK
jgi:hypothetical protein